MKLGAFADYLAQIRDPGESGVPDTIYDDLNSSYETDIAGRDETITGHEAKIAEMDASLQSANNEISRLNAVNAEMLDSAPGNDLDAEPDNDGPVADDDEDIEIDDLFENKE